MDPRVNSPRGSPFRPCDTGRDIATSSRPVARVHTGATGTLVPVSRDHLATWNERARLSVAPCQLCRVDRPGASARSSDAISTRLFDLINRRRITEAYRAVYIDLLSSVESGIILYNSRSAMLSQVAYPEKITRLDRANGWR